MGVEIRCCGEITVSQPLLNHLHGNAVGKQKTGTAVSEVVETDVAELVLAQNPLKPLIQVVGRKTLADLVHADVVKVVLAVGPSAELTVMGLLFQLPEQQRPDGRCERKCPQTGLGLCGIGHDLYVLPVKSAGSNRVADCDGVALEVDCTPSETKQFAFSQTIECCELDRYFKDVTFDAVKQEKYIFRDSIWRLCFGCAVLHH